MAKKNLLRLICSFFLITVAIIFYILLHGTSNLVIIKKLKYFLPFIPEIRGIKFYNQFLFCYFIDILWFSSFILLSPFLIPNSNFWGSTIILLISIFLEGSQYFFHALGTFDFFDILCYVLIWLIYNTFSKLLQKKNAT